MQYTLDPNWFGIFRAAMFVSVVYPLTWVSFSAIHCIAKPVTGLFYWLNSIWGKATVAIRVGGPEAAWEAHIGVFEAVISDPDP